MISPTFCARSLLAPALLAAGIAATGTAAAAEYKIDDAHSAVHFKVNHLGVSWLRGRFNTFSGEFKYDAADPDESSVTIEIETDSIDTNHAERDKHLRSSDFLNVSEYPDIRFVSTGFAAGIDGGFLVGDLTLYGTTRTVAIDVTKVGEGPDPWGGYRVGFPGSTEVQPKDFAMEYDLGPLANTIYITLDIEGVRK